MANNTGALSEVSFAFKEVTWKIPNFLELPRIVGHYVKSPEFRFASATWCLRMYTSKDLVSTDNMPIHLVRLQSSVPEHRIDHTISLITLRGREHESHSQKSTLKDDKSEVLLNFYRHCDIMAKRHFLERNGTVTVFCKISVKEEASSRHRNEECQTESNTQTELQEASSQTDVPESASQAEVEEASTSVQKLQTDYSKLLKSEEESDVCLKVSGKEFRAHRCILRARSKVFCAMFKYETEEKTSGEVVIDDLDPDSFPDFLQYVYAGRVESLSSKNMSSLYSAADKYDLQDLKSECRDYMRRTLSVDTFCDVMTLALRHQEEELLKLAIEFFTKNLTRIIVTVKWQTFSKHHNTEANELFIKALVTGEENES